MVARKKNKQKMGGGKNGISKEERRGKKKRKRGNTRGVASLGEKKDLCAGKSKSKTIYDQVGEKQNARPSTKVQTSDRKKIHEESPGRNKEKRKGN